MIANKKGVKCLEMTEYTVESGDVRSVLVKLESNQNYMLLKNTFQKYIDDGVIVVDDSTKRLTKHI